ncbi:MAG TPA: multidrug ABC transporter permease [Candidatus Aminicenantes bacterium]|nr:multidrug ABC transporter permease [Candidatus Aminicenantes bacterium]
MKIHGTAIYVLWRRELVRYLRAKSRIFGSLAMPVFFLAFLGLGFRRMPIPGLEEGAGYIGFLAPGIIGMTLLFSSTMQGMSVLWDKEFGFLKEIMVAPVSRVSLVLGRIAGGATTSMLQGLLIFGASLVMGFRFRGPGALAFGFVFMLLISFTFIGLGLIFASRMKDMQGFGVVMNFVIFPFFFLSGALTPLDNFPWVVRALSYADPLTYGVDGLRGVLTGTSSLPVLVDLAVLTGFALAMLFLGAWFFETSEGV